MTEHDDKLLRQFLAPARQEISDNGFTQRVMRQLAHRPHPLARFWTVCCTLLALLLFIALDGWRLILYTLRETFITLLESGAENLDSQSLVIAVVVLMLLGCRKAVRMA